MVSVAIDEVVAEVCSQFSQDGMRLVVQRTSEESRRVELGLDLTDVDCVDCVMPSEYLKRLVQSGLSERLGRDYLVEICDPRTVYEHDAGSETTVLQEKVLVLDPTASVRAGSTDPGPEVGEIRGKTVLFRLDELWKSWAWVVDEWSTQLSELGATVVTWLRNQGEPGEEGETDQAKFESLVRDADLLISGLANCGSCTAWTIHDALIGLSQDTATVAIATEYFLSLAKIVADDGGRAGMRIYSLPYPLNSLPEDEVREIARNGFASVLDLVGARQ